MGIDGEPSHTPARVSPPSGPSVGCVRRLTPSELEPPFANRRSIRGLTAGDHARHEIDCALVSVEGAIPSFP